MIQLSDIQAALNRIRADIRVSPCTHSETFSSLTNNSIFLKLDNQQRNGAFKERRALNKLLTLSPEERFRGVIAASAGVYPDLAHVAAAELAGSGVHVASVATAFPSGRASLEVKLADVKFAAAAVSSQEDSMP